MNLESLLRERLTGDPRALIGALDIEHDRIFLHFGAIGALVRVSFCIQDDDIWLIAPTSEDAEALKSAKKSVSGGADIDALTADLASVSAERDALKEDVRRLIEELAAKTGETAPADPALAELGRSEGGGADVSQTGSGDAETSEATTLAGQSDEAGAGAAGAETSNVNSGEGGEAGKPALIDPEDHKHTELVAMAETLGVEIDKKASKAVIAAAINKHNGH